MLQEIRQTIRALALDRAFSATAVVTVALAIAINAAIFSILHAVVLSPLPYTDPGRVVAVWEVLEGEGGHLWRVSPKTFLDWREKSRVFSAIAAFGGSNATLTGAGDPIALNGSRATDQYFGLLGVTPLLGRSFRAEDTVSGSSPVVLISEAPWTTRWKFMSENPGAGLA